VSKKLRKTLASEGRVGNHSTRNDDSQAIVVKDTFRSSSKKKDPNKMSPKVLETWINETLQDAENLDIPGCILKPEQKNPISRYGIDK
jgi:hypothetical protein